MYKVDDYKWTQNSNILSCYYWVGGGQKGVSAWDSCWDTPPVRLFVPPIYPSEMISPFGLVVQQAQGHLDPCHFP